MSYFVEKMYAILVPSISVGVCLFLAGFLMDSREEEDHRGIMGNLLGAAGVMGGLGLSLFLAQWVSIIEYLIVPIMWVLIFLCFRLNSLIEMVALCILSIVLKNLVMILVVGMS